MLVALIPLAALYVTKVIVNDIVDYRQHQTALPHNFWYLVGLEFALAGLLAGVLIRMVAYFEVVLADRYSKHISTRIMEHASKLDLTTFEDPLFYDKMERARVQGTDRLVMIQSTGMLIQQLVTTISMAGMPLVMLWIMPDWIWRQLTPSHAASATRDSTSTAATNAAMSKSSCSGSSHTSTASMP